MSRWEERIRTSTAANLIADLRSRLDQARPSSTEEAEDLAHLRLVVDLVDRVFTTVDPHLISARLLDAFAQHLSNTRDHLQSWKDGVQGALPAAVTAADEALGIAGVVPAAVTGPEVEIDSLRRQVESFRSLVDGVIQATQQRAMESQHEMTHAVSQLEARVAETEQEAVRVRETAQSNLTAANEQLTSQQNAFAAAQNERQEAFSRLLDEKRKEAAASTERLVTESQEVLTQYGEEIAELVNKAEQNQRRVEEILQIVGQEALVGTHSKNASADANAANIWRLVAVGALGLTVVVGFWLLGHAESAGEDWDAFGARLLLLLAVGALAGYAARQSSEHRAAQREAQHVALQLAALGPYLDNLTSPDERDRLLGEIAMRLFGQPRSERGDQALAELVADNPSGLAQVLTAVAGLKK